MDLVPGGMEKKKKIFRRRCCNGDWVDQKPAAGVCVLEDLAFFTIWEMYLDRSDSKDGEYEGTCGEIVSTYCCTMQGSACVHVISKYQGYSTAVGEIGHGIGFSLLLPRFNPGMARPFEIELGHLDESERSCVNLVLLENWSEESQCSRLGRSEHISIQRCGRMMT